MMNCLACDEYEPDPTRHYWTKHRGKDGYVCLSCLGAVLERGLSAMAFCKTDKSHG